MECNDKILINERYEYIVKERLGDAIKNSGLPLHVIARKLGVSNSMVSQYCNTKKLPRLDNLVRLCKILDISLNYILGLSDY